MEGKAGPFLSKIVKVGVAIQRTDSGFVVRQFEMKIFIINLKSIKQLSLSSLDYIMLLKVTLF